MDDRLLVSEQYIERHPGAAARVLRNLPAADVAALLSALSPPLAGQALGHMAAIRGALIAAAMPAETAVTVLAELPDDKATAIIRLLDAPLRNTLLQSLPEIARRQVAESLEYAADSVGSIMTRSIVVLDRSAPVRDALAAVREHGGDGHDWVFVTNRHHEVTGLVPVTRLVRSSKDTRLGELIDQAPPVLPARISTAAILDHPAWLTMDVLPVVNRERQLVGALTHAALRRALADPNAMSRVPSGSILISMSEDLVDSVAGLWSLMLDSPTGTSRSRSNNR